MRVTIGELLGVTTAEEGERLEHEASMRRWEQEHAADIADRNARLADARARFGLAPAAAPAVPVPHVLTLAELHAAPWASCGPASLAALLGRSLAEIHRAFPDKPAGQTWTSHGQMCDAIEATFGRRRCWRPTGFDPREGLPANRAWPVRGLVLVQFRGSWDALPEGHSAPLQRSHWIAVKPHPTLAGVPLIFDINAIDDGPPMSLAWWQPLESWHAIIRPEIAKSYEPKATGEWWVRAGIEVLDGGAR
jgi:hypothetical protein